MASGERVFPELESMSIVQRESLLATDLKAHIQAKKLASYPLEACQHHDISGLSAVAKKIASVSREWPSCGIALCMHYNVLIALHRVPIFSHANEVLNKVLHEEALMASAFSELLPDKGIFSPALKLHRPQPGTIQLTGTKRPCTLASQADFLVVSCTSGEAEPVRVALIPRRNGVNADPTLFKVTVFGASDTQGLVLTEAEYEESVLDLTDDDSNVLHLLGYGMLLFNILIGACYSGIMRELFAQIHHFAKNDPEILSAWARFEVLSAVTIKHMIQITANPDSVDPETDVLVLRYQLEREILGFTELLWKRLSSQCILGNPNVAHLISTCRMIKYHPMTEQRFLSELMRSQSSVLEANNAA